MTQMTSRPFVRRLRGSFHGLVAAVACLGCRAPVQENARAQTSESNTSLTRLAPPPIEGDADFVAWTEEALELLHSRAPGWYGYVVENLTGIVATKDNSGVFVMTGLYAVGVDTAHAPGWDRRTQLVWYASTLVHDSTHMEIISSGRLPGDQGHEVESLENQAAVLGLIDTNPYLRAYVQGLIDGADDPANQYWNIADPSW